MLIESTVPEYVTHKDHPHRAITHFMFELFESITGARYVPGRSDPGFVGRKLRAILDCHSPGVGVSSEAGPGSGMIYGYWDWESNGNFIREFEKLTRYTVYYGFNETDFDWQVDWKYPFVVYSPDEIRGWLSWFAWQNERYRSGVKDEMLASYAEYFDPLSYYELIKRKLSGQEPWRFGLTGTCFEHMQEEWLNEVCFGIVL